MKCSGFQGVLDSSEEKLAPECHFHNKFRTKSVAVNFAWFHLDLFTLHHSC
jgi:hypothetical protein